MPLFSLRKKSTVIIKEPDDPTSIHLLPHPQASPLSPPHPAMERLIIKLGAWMQNRSLISSHANTHQSSHKLRPDF